VGDWDGDWVRGGEGERERESQSRAGLMSFTKEPAKMPVKLIR
jgi:hypothetical protein